MPRRALLLPIVLSFACKDGGAASTGDDLGTGDTSSAATSDASDPSASSAPDDSGSSGASDDESDTDPADGTDTDPTGTPTCEATQFGADASAWTLPDTGLPLSVMQPFTTLADAWGCDNEQSFRYTTLDLTGDGVLDLVATDACDAADVGAELWMYYEGGDGGFADAPAAWTLPDHGFPVTVTQPFTTLADAWGCDNEQSFRYTTLDLTGDGVLDLVLTDACDASDTGVAFWLVYAGGDGGFADEPAIWTLPDTGFPISVTQPFTTLADAWGCDNEQSFRYTTLDLTGDHVLDLVVTDACDAADVGDTLWLVYKGGSDGFANEPTPWMLPDHGFPVSVVQPFTTLADAWGCDNEQSFRYTTLDLTDDGVLDLVLTDACDAADVGATLWLVYEGGDGGFANEPTPWTLPDTGFPVTVTQPFTTLADAWGCDNEQSFRYTTLDLGGDGVLDLVVTDACDTGDAGVDLWLVYEGGEGGFASEPAVWSLPALGLPLSVTQPLTTLADAWGCDNEQSFRYTTLDLDGEGHLDLVVTDACDPDDVGVTLWTFYPGQCA